MPKNVVRPHMVRLAENWGKKRDDGIEKAIDALGRLMDSLNRIENSLPNVKDESLPGIKSEVSRYETLIGLVGGKGFERKHALESLEPMLKHKMPYEVY